MLAAGLRRDGVVLQKGVRVWGVQQGAGLLPRAPAKRVAELLGQFLWRVDQRQVVLHGAAPQLHPQLKLGNCILAAQTKKTQLLFITEHRWMDSKAHIYFKKKKLRTRWRCLQSRCR